MSLVKIEEFVRQLDEMRIQYPGDAEDVLEDGAKKMTKAIRKATPVGDTNHPHRLKKSWRCKIKGYRAADIRAEIRSAAPHFHLVNRGVQNPKDVHGNPKPEWLSAFNRHKGFLQKAVQDNWDGIKDGMAKDFYQKVRDHLG